MILAVASPSSSVYSETFIRMQMERLPCILRIHGGPVASETIPGGQIKPLGTLRGLIDTAVECGFRRKRWEGPHGKELGRRLRHAGVTTVLANYGHTGVELLPICRDNGIKLVVHFHGYDAHMASVVEQYVEQYAELGNEATAIIAVSNRMVDALVSYGIAREKIHLIRYGADPSKFSAIASLPGDPLFFGVGRFVDKKAPYLTVLAFKDVYVKYPNARLVLAGDGPLFEATRNLCSVLDLTAAVKFTGVISPMDVADWMSRATAYVQHSITPQYGPSKGDSEGTPVAILEAMITGIPVISTRHAGISDVIDHGKSGLLVEERDVVAMTQAMLALCADRDLALKLGEAARKKALIHYSADTYIGSLMAILESV